MFLDRFASVFVLLSSDYIERLTFSSLLSAARRGNSDFGWLNRRVFEASSVLCSFILSPKTFNLHTENTLPKEFLNPPLSIPLKKRLRGLKRTIIL